MSTSWHSMRASDSDRQRTIDVIKAAVAEGRLTMDEHGQRIDQIMRAQTYGDLQSIVADLPSGVHGGPSTSVVLPQQSSSWQVQPAGPRKTNDLAVASVVCGGLGFMTGITAIPAIITGHMALARIRANNEDGRGMAIAGLVMGYTVAIGIASILALMVFVFVAFGVG